MLSHISLEDLVIILTVVCGACVIVSFAMFAWTLNLLLQVRRHLEANRPSFVQRDSQGRPYRTRR